MQLGTIGRTYEMQADTHLGNFFETGVASLRNKGHMMKSQVQRCPNCHVTVECKAMHSSMYMPKDQVSRWTAL